MLELLISNAKGKDISELIASGKEKMASVLSGCGGRGGGAVEVKIAEKVEEKEEEKVAEQKEEESDDVSFLARFCVFIFTNNLLYLFLYLNHSCC